MRWPWSKKPAPPAIPPYPPETARPAHISVRQQHAPAPGIEVQEVDTSKMTETGIFKAWKRMTGQK